MLSIIRNGTEYSLDDDTYCRLLSDEGAGMLPMHRLSERGPQQHGMTDRGYYYDPRYIILSLGVIGTSLADMETKRRNLISIFAPQTNSLQLKYTLPSGAVRYIECHYLDGLNMPHTNTGTWLKEVVTLVCPDPTFYDPAFNIGGFNISAGADTWVVPFEVPLTIGASTIDSDAAITYSGDADSYPIIRITGPANDPILTNETLDLKLDFTGGTVNAGDYYELDLRYGRKTVVDSGGTAQISKLTSDSDVATFRIAADPDASGGINSLNFSCTGATTATKCDVIYYDRYIGI